jgi:hypothetical protein
MSDVKIRFMTPEEMGEELQNLATRMKENKYDFQTKLKDLNFDIDEGKAADLGILIPFHSIEDAEEALRQRVILPTVFVEYDEAEHQVAAFDPQPVGFSGFQNCVTHSLSLTDQGVFEVGRFAAVDFDSSGRNWQWFLHRRIATSEETALWQETYRLSPDELHAITFEAVTGVFRAECNA